ncbi:DUF4252 domain-containing protein [Prolixibacteraceae bacterium Z1-6]|uniref:DUF4252 domain-containing protein n=1 Tax=Draconibacterium aestuarii TaxID=2998507 RepID=A0A9X3FGP4_9BACT|nr:DUF4252 domain-containing protein [Prolixibacteraceae bacterium Z1-6]
MKILALLSVAILFVFTSCSYEPGVSEAFTKYRFKDGVTTVTVPGWVISLAAGIGDLDESEREILDCIDKVKVISIDNDDLNSRTNLHEEFYEQINRNKAYEELLVVREEDESVTVFGRMDESVIKEMVILVGGEDNAMIYIKGEISPELINKNINFSHPDKLLSFDF